MVDFRNLAWMNPPPYERGDGDELIVRTAGQTDFWRGTFYGFWHDSGHFMSQSVSGDFTAEVTISGDFVELYDQAGLMVRLSETCWVKGGIEYTDGAMHLSVVVTNDNSDWSQMPLRTEVGPIRLRLTRHGEAIRIQYLENGGDQWKAARLAYIPKTERIDVGIMCCSPKREGLEVSFKNFTIEQAVARELH